MKRKIRNLVAEGIGCAGALAAFLLFSLMFYNSVWTPGAFALLGGALAVAGFGWLMHD